MLFIVQKNMKRSVGCALSDTICSRENDDRYCFVFWPKNTLLFLTPI